MSWRDFKGWEKGGAIGLVIWLAAFILIFFRYFYSRFFVESLGSKVQPFLFFTFPNLVLLAIYGIVLVLLGGLVGYLLEIKRDNF